MTFPDPRTVTSAIPPGATDCHMHVFEARYPPSPSRTYTPGPAPLDQYRKVAAALRLSRAVVVQPSAYGTDNSCTLDGMAQLGPTARGVAVVDTSVSDAELKRLHGLGIRGIRFNLVQAGATTVEMLEPLSRRVNELGVTFNNGARYLVSATAGTVSQTLNCFEMACGTKAAASTIPASTMLSRNGPARWIWRAWCSFMRAVSGSRRFFMLVTPVYVVFRTW